MASNVTGKNTAQKKSSSAVNRQKTAGNRKTAVSNNSAEKGKGAAGKGSSVNKNSTQSKNSTQKKRNTQKESSTQKKSSTQRNNKIQDWNPNDKTAGGKQSLFLEESDRKNLNDEVRFLAAVGITILLTMCNFHYCLSVGNAVYFVLHGLFGWLAYILPFVFLGAYLFMIPNRGNLEALTKTKLCLLLFLECCCLFHFVGIKESQPFSPVYYFLAGQSGFNGGLVGGLFSGLLQHLIGTAATILIIFFMMLITVIILTERSAVHTMQNCAGAVQSLTGGKFRSIREKFQELFSEEEDDFEYYDDGGYEDHEDFEEEEDDKHGISVHENDDTGGNSRFGRTYIWNRNPSDTDGKPTEFFNREFPFMEKTEDVGKTESAKTEPDYGTMNQSRKQSEEKTADHYTDTPFQDENWRKGFSSAKLHTVKSETGLPEPGVVPSVSREGKPGTAAGRIVLERESRSLAEMGFGSLLQEEETPAGNSIDDFIVYNGLAPEKEIPANPLFTEGGEYDNDFGDVSAVPEDTYPIPEEMYVQPESAGDFGESAGDSGESAGDFKDTAGNSEDTDRSSAVPGERAVDLTEHVVLPEDGPVMRRVSESGNDSITADPDGSGLISVDSSAAGKFSVGRSGQQDKSAGGIWKQDSGNGSRGSSGAVTFSSRPKAAEKASVVKKPYVFPPATLLKRNMAFSGGLSRSHREIQQKLHDTLQSFGVKVNMGMISVGPAVTRYELEPEPGVKVSRIVALQDDIKLALAAPDIRIEAPIPGKSAIGIEVPNQDNTVVGFRELIESEAFQKHSSKVAVAVGRDISGQIVVADLAKMPHLLIAGATGSGKSVCINTLIMSIIYKASPEEVKLVMVDPKVVELSIYNGIPHLLVPVVTDARKAANALRWAVEEMNDRYKKFAEYNVRNIEGYNEHLRREKEKDPSNAEPLLYQMVIIVDELADLMMVAQGEVEEAICRLAQMARAAGIHLVLATQRPSVNVITGLIKANVPSRIAFAVSSGVDSRTIIDMNGAEKLLGKGDMLFYPYGLPKPVRVQGAFISDEEVSRVVSWLHKNNGGVSGQEMMEKMITSASENAAVKTELDEYFESAGRFIIEKDKASIGALQRNFKIGFNRAARIMDQLAAAGVVGEEDGTKPRKILMSMDEFNQFLEAQQ